MNRWRSLRLRLFLATTPALLLVVAFTLVTIAQIFETTVTRQFDVRISGYLEQVAGVVGSEQMVRSLNQKLSGGEFGQPFSGLYWQVQSEGGALHRSRSLWDEKITLPTDTVGFDELHSHGAVGPLQQRLRVLERRIIAPDATRWSIAVAANRIGLDAEIAEFRQSLIWFGTVLFGLVLLIALAQFIVIQRPVIALGRAIGRLKQGEQTRLTGSFPNELDELIGNLNHLLEHNEENAKSARMQATNLAHTIKTPVTILKNEIDRHRRRDTDTDWSVIDENLDRINKMSQFYLTRAQVARSPNRLVRKTHVRPIVFGVVQAMRRLHEDRHIDITYLCDDAVLFDGDATDLEEVLGNVLDNAVKWAQSLVTLQCRSDHEGLQLIIVDDGPGIPASGREEMLRPGERLDDTVPGTGFGLAIAVELVNSYGGALDLSDAEPTGLRIQIFFPARAAD